MKKLNLDSLKEKLDDRSPRRFSKKAGKLKTFLLLSMLFSGLTGLPETVAGQSPAVQNQARTTQKVSAASAYVNPKAAIIASYADVVEKVTPAVVAVRSEKKTSAKLTESPFSNDPFFREFFGDRLPQMKQQPQIRRGLGSGVIVESNGTILTNNHVVEGASRVRVDLPDKRTFDAKVVGTDPATDLAVLKIEATNLPTIRVGDSDAVRVGDVVLAVGNPLGLRQTVTSGIISAKGRQTRVSNGSFEDFLQTDAPINQGNSGGALVNLAGELIGINSQIVSPSGGSVGLGFAIPSNMAKSVMSQLVSAGKVRRGMLGVGIQDVTSELAASFDLQEIRGVVVNSVSPNSPAERAGLREGDVILSYNGARVEDGNDLRNRVAQTAPNTRATIGISRNGAEQTLTTTLGELQAKSPTGSGDDQISDADPAMEDKLGLALEPVTPQLAKQLELKQANGVIIKSVEGGSPADDAGLQPGDVILQVNRRPVKSVAEIKTALLKSGDKSVLFLISRDGQNLFVPVRL